VKEGEWETQLLCNPLTPLPKLLDHVNTFRTYLLGIMKDAEDKARAEAVEKAESKILEG
jgi:hypothetical protein